MPMSLKDVKDILVSPIVNDISRIIGGFRDATMTRM